MTTASTKATTSRPTKKEREKANHQRKGKYKKNPGVQKSSQRERLGRKDKDDDRKQPRVLAQRRRGHLKINIARISEKPVKVSADSDGDAARHAEAKSMGCRFLRSDAQRPKKRDQQTAAAQHSAEKESRFRTRRRDGRPAAVIENAIQGDAHDGRCTREVAMRARESSRLDADARQGKRGCRRGR